VFDDFPETHPFNRNPPHFEVFPTESFVLGVFQHLNAELGYFWLWQILESNPNVCTILTKNEFRRKSRLLFDWLDAVSFGPSNDNKLCATFFCHLMFPYMAPHLTIALKLVSSRVRQGRAGEPRHGHS
jgi:hypothetical protein